MYKTISVCRACNYGRTGAPGTKADAASEKLVAVFDLGIQPLANDFCKPEEEHAGFAPLKVMFCPRCSLAQLSVVVDPQILYHDYAYVTSTSKTMQEHFKNITSMMAMEAGSKRLLEIGSNDGAFLDFLQTRGWQVTGVDPAENLCKKAYDKGVQSICDFWTAKTGASVAGFRPGIILARHVFCHVEDWNDFVRGLELAATDETLVCIEVPYVADLLAKGEFDTVYHEHTSYLSIKAMSALLAESRFRLHKITHLSIHGGALFIMLRTKGHEEPPDKSVSQFLNSEDCGEEAWKNFSEASSQKICRLRNFVNNLRGIDGKHIVGYGASAKSTVWLNACNLDRLCVERVYDNTDEKLYRHIPGTNIPIAHEGALYVDNPDYAIMFCWNFCEEVLQKPLCKKWMAGGGKFIVPHPEIRVIGAEEAKIELASV